MSGTDLDAIHRECINHVNTHLGGVREPSLLNPSPKPGVEVPPALNTALRAYLEAVTKRIEAANQPPVARNPADDKNDIFEATIEYGNKVARRKAAVPLVRARLDRAVMDAAREVVRVANSDAVKSAYPEGSNGGDALELYKERLGFEPAYKQDQEPSPSAAV